MNAQSENPKSEPNATPATPGGGHEEQAERLDFLRTQIAADLSAGKNGGRVHTRFPPEPNGYLHIGHVKAICLNFQVAEEFGGLCNLRFDDTNPATEEAVFVEAMQQDIHWLGFDWGERMFFASDYFEKLYGFACELIEKGLAYVCDLSAAETREYRGTVTEPGRNSPARERSAPENLELFAGMRAGDFPDGSRTLRAKIDMASPNLNLRDPVLYRISSVPHHKTGTDWRIYPMYDWAHGQGDAIEGITHSLCSLEFENHRPLYEWFLANISAPSVPRQIEFARLNIAYTLTAKRKLRLLVEQGLVSDWDDPRMPTIRGMRRRGYTPEALRHFIAEIGLTKTNSIIDMAVLENSLRADLNRRCERRMAVLDPLKVVITNYPEDQEQELEAINNPEDESAGTRRVPFGRELWIERADFMEEAPKKFFRLAPEREVRLRYAYAIRCNEVIKDAAGEVVELRCTYDPETANGQTPDGRKIKGIIHWVAAKTAVAAEVRLYDHLFSEPDPTHLSAEDEQAGKTFIDNLNPNSLERLSDCWLEPALAQAKLGVPYQFERLGYFTLDSSDNSPDALVFNRTVTLRDTWSKKAKR